jgi:hypothetical protein
VIYTPQAGCVALIFPPDGQTFAVAHKNINLLGSSGLYSFLKKHVRITIGQIGGDRLKSLKLGKNANVATAVRQAQAGEYEDALRAIVKSDPDNASPHGAALALVHALVSGGHLSVAADVSLHELASAPDPEIVNIAVQTLASVGRFPEIGSIAVNGGSAADGVEQIQAA